MKNKIVIVATLLVFICQLQAQNEHYTKELNKGYQGAIIEDIKYLKNALNFAVLGDWGRYGNPHQKAVAEQLSGAMAGIDGDFIISTGDNFYPSGVKSIHDPSWKYSFEDVYTSYHLHRDWYVILGNHDYVTNPEAQVAYSNISARWKLPFKYYSFKKNIQGTKKKHVEFFMVDTSPLQPDYYEGDFYMKNQPKQDTLAQKKWLEKSLKESTATWKIVVGHHPMYSSGNRKGRTSAMENSFKALFEKYKVDAYICGHEHHLEYDKPKEVSFVQFISGSGSEVTGVTETPYAIFAKKDFGFITFSISEDQMLVQFINSKGEIIYTTTRDKKG